MAALFVRYVGLGGGATSRQLDAYFAHGSAMAEGEHDMAVHALNERFLELGRSERLPYLVGGPPH